MQMGYAQLHVVGKRASLILNWSTPDCQLILDHRTSTPAHRGFFNAIARDHNVNPPVTAQKLMDNDVDVPDEVLDSIAYSVRISQQHSADPIESDNGAGIDDKILKEHIKALEDPSEVPHVWESQKPTDPLKEGDTLDVCFTLRFFFSFF